MQTEEMMRRCEKTIGDKGARPPAVLLPFMKLPLAAFRLGISRLFGRFFVCLTHVGRKSGKIRKTILAVMDYDARRDEIFVIAPWSACDWFKNISARPALRIETGLECFEPEQRFLTPDEIAGLLEGYRCRRPALSRILCRIPGWKWDSTREEFLELAGTLRGVAFRPRKRC